MPAILTNSTYSTTRGGHAPGDLRDAFREAFNAFMAWADSEPEPSIHVREHTLSLRGVCGLLWNCSDIIPSSYWSDVQDLLKPWETGPGRQTYGAVARWLKHRIETQT